MDIPAAAMVILATLIAFAVAVAAMALGGKLTGRCLRGSCGGPAAHGPDGEPLSCATCPNRERSTR
jgi:hypothetical protein